MPEGQKSYSKTKPIQFEEFKPIIEWWNNRKESDVAWKVKVEDLKEWDLDIKNPNKKEEEITYSTAETLVKFQSSLNKINELFNQIKSELE